jgi:selenide,water dikinase
VLQPLRDIFNEKDHPDVLVGLASADDAAVYRLDDRRALVATIDFFPPVVDDPYDFGAIAAANAISDIYAMGGKPLFAINLVAFPSGLNLDYLREILRGGAEKTAEAGAVIAGGHSVSDKEPKYGLAVTGEVELSKIKTKAKTKPGDRLILTKPLGTGLITTALKNKNADPAHVAEAVRSMKQLNKEAAEAADKLGVVSMTDVTGFGLLGHAHEMAHLSAVNLRLFFGALRFLAGTRDYAKAGAFPGGMHNNKHFYSPWVTFDENLSDAEQDIVWTPETSGGLLVSIAEKSAETYLRLVPQAKVIGIVEPGDGHIHVE